MNIHLQTVYVHVVCCQDGIYKLCLSPNGLIVAAVHQFGGISFLDVPSLRLRHFWYQEQQVNLQPIVSLVPFLTPLHNLGKIMLLKFLIFAHVRRG